MMSNTEHEAQEKDHFNGTVLAPELVSGRRQVPDIFSVFTMHRVHNVNEIPLIQQSFVNPCAQAVLRPDLDKNFCEAVWPLGTK